jgi:hypothetical protein
MRKAMSVLGDRLKSLGLSVAEVAQTVSELRSQEYGEEKEPVAIYSSVRRGIAAPDTVSLKNFKLLVKAMGGEVVIRWAQTESVVSGHEDVLL